MAAKKVKIYSTPYCVHCDRAKNFFNKNKINYVEIDISEDEEAAAEMVKKSGQMYVPVIEIDNDIIVGFNEPKIKKLLGVK